ncbi:MAG TPA: SPOR domain-containing protein [Coxiellaceae bacterium]|nr:SPOR domain-containing protein [Coxiellaceae bacterium]
MRDYARKSPPQRKNHAPNFEWVFVFFLLCILSIGGYFTFHAIQKHVIQVKLALAQRSAQVLELAKKSPVKQTVLSQNQNQSHEDTMKFDFYKILPTTTVNVPNEAPSPADTQADGTHFYILQVATLKANRDAISAQEMLKNKGYPAFVQSYQSNDKTGYRVLVGPFETRIAAEVAQNKLYSADLPSLLIVNKKKT